MTGKDHLAEDALLHAGANPGAGGPRAMIITAPNRRGKTARRLTRTKD